MKFKFQHRKKSFEFQQENFGNLSPLVTEEPT